MVLDKTATLILDNVVIGGNLSSPASDGVDLSASVDFGVGYSVTFGATAILGAQVELFADPTGASIIFSIGTYDDPYDSGDIENSAGHTVKGFIPLQRGAKFVKARIKNLDLSASITAASLWAIVQEP